MMRVNWLIGVIVGILIGLIGALLYAWQIDPPTQFNTNPWQLNAEGQRHYMIAVSVSYGRDRDVSRAAARLVELNYGSETWRKLAETACALSGTNYISTASGINTVKSMVELAQSQGVTGCASLLFPNVTITPTPTEELLPTATFTLTPPATKTPIIEPSATPTIANEVAPLPTVTPEGEYQLVLTETFCNPLIQGVIEVIVQDTKGNGIAGVMIQVENGSTVDTFFTGLKVERGGGFADYQMASGNSYIVVVPGSIRTRPFEPTNCNLLARDGGGKAIASYRLTVRRVGGR